MPVVRRNSPRWLRAEGLMGIVGKLASVALLLAPLTGRGAADWIHTNQPLWGLRNGVQFAVYPAGFNAHGTVGPRGLIRVGAPVLPEGGHALVNFIAVEPVVKGRRGFSELERSVRDQAPGKHFQAGVPQLTAPAAGVEGIEVPVAVEAFGNGAHIRLVLAQRSDAPDELRCTVHAVPGSAPVEFCILTATMGNMVRTRQLWLHAEVLNSLRLYPNFHGDGFAPPTVRALPHLARNTAGDVVVAVTGNEADPAAVFPFPGSLRWHYAGAPVTQYWRVPKVEVHPELQVAVNARCTYWQTTQPLPGGVAFENFELRAPFREGQTFIFGVTRRRPAELGIAAVPQGGP